MKKLLVLIMALALVVSLIGCDLLQPSCSELGPKAMKAYQNGGEQAYVKVMREGPDNCTCYTSRNILSGQILSVQCTEFTGY